MGILGPILTSFKQSFGVDGKSMKGTYSRFSQTVPKHAALYRGVKEIQRSVSVFLHLGSFIYVLMILHVSFAT